VAFFLFLSIFLSACEPLYQESMAVTFFFDPRALPSFPPLLFLPFLGTRPMVVNFFGVDDFSNPSLLDLTQLVSFFDKIILVPMAASFLRHYIGLSHFLRIVLYPFIPQTLSFLALHPQDSSNVSNYQSTDPFFPSQGVVSDPPPF